MFKEKKTYELTVEHGYKTKDKYIIDRTAIARPKPWNLGAMVEWVFKERYKSFEDDPVKVKTSPSICQYDRDFSAFKIKMQGLINNEIVGTCAEELINELYMAMFFERKLYNPFAPKRWAKARDEAGNWTGVFIIGFWSGGQGVWAITDKDQLPKLYTEWKEL